MGTDAVAAAMGRGQHGLVTRAQLVGAGVGRSTVQRRLVAGAWAATGAVVDLGTHTATWAQAVMRAVLGSPEGSLASHRTAAHLHGLLDVGRPDVIEVTVPRAGRSRPTAFTLHSTTVTDVGTTTDGIPVVRWPRAVRELAGTTTERALARVVAQELRERRDAARRLVAELEACGPTVAGVGRLRRVLVAELGSDRRLLESPLEDRWYRALEWADLRPEAVQHQLHDDRGELVGRLDIAWPSVLYALEVDGRAHHTAAHDRTADAERDSRGTTLGWLTRRVTAADLAPSRRTRVLAAIRATIDERHDSMAAGAVER